MPPYSTLRTFVTSLQTGRTNITESLERLMTNPGRHQTDPNFTALQAVDALKAPLPAWARTTLAQSGMSNDEIDHIDIWPDEQKERVRGKLVDAILGDRSVTFSWELYGGDAPATEVQEPGELNTTVHIVFRSPQSGVQLDQLNFGFIHVQV